jgi:hypothetical protein
MKITYLIHGEPTGTPGLTRDNLVIHSEHGLIRADMMHISRVVAHEPMELPDAERHWPGQAVRKYEEILMEQVQNERRREMDLIIQN